VIKKLRQHGLKVIAFVGPEEQDITESLRASVDPSVPVIFEPSPRKFAALIAGLDLLICCDSGPMHLACATGVPVLAIFQERNLDRWSPPPSAARIVHDLNGVDAATVLEAALEELSVEKLADDSPVPPAAFT
jgi:ADP-heptose:LPS heptosyltransferase